MGRFCYEEKYDVLIAGGGVSGAVSAIAAGRMGAKVLVIEQNGYLGGSLTGCGVGPMMTFHAGEKQVILGIMEEIVGRLVNRGYSVGHIYDTMQYISYLTPFNAEGLKLILMKCWRKPDAGSYSTLLQAGYIEKEAGSILLRYVIKTVFTGWKQKFMWMLPETATLHLWQGHP